MGDELLEGHQADGHTVWLARRITGLGGRVVTVRIVGDDPDEIGGAIRESAGCADLVVVCGGIGPTEDDRTREGVSCATGRPLVEVPAAVEAIAATLRSRGIQSQPGHHRQGTVTEGGRWLVNPEGVAPGIEAELDGATIVVLPGVPTELHAMYAAHIVPWLEARGGKTVAERGIWAAGIGEPKVEARIGDALAGHGVRVGYYPHEGEIEVRLFARGPDATSQVEAALAVAAMNLAGDGYIPPAGGRIEHVVVGALIERGLSVTTAESLTGGLVAEMLTRVPGASAVFPGGWITYASAQKTAQLGVSPALIAERGVVSEAVVRAMAEGARSVMGTSVALATTGVAGPGPFEEPGCDPVPAGRVFVAMAVEGGETVVRRLDAPMSRGGVRRRAAVAVLDLLRRHLGV